MCNYEWIIASQYLEQYFNGLREREKSEASIRNRPNKNQKAQNKIMNQILRDLLAVLLVKSFSICHKGIYNKTRGIQVKSCIFSTPGEMLQCFALVLKLIWAFSIVE